MSRPLSLRGVPRIPSHCVWELTNACNLDCVHCESACGESKSNELSTEEALQLCADLKSIGCRTVNLSGGEPLLRKDWSEICARLVSLGMRPIIVSNLTCLKEEHVRAMEAAGVNAVATSIDGPAPIHDMIRRTRGQGPSPFSVTLDAVRTLKAKGFSVYVITHVNRWNLSALAEMGQIVEAVGADLWQLQIGFPEGRLREIAADYQIHPGQMDEICRFITDFREKSRTSLCAGHNIGYYCEGEPRVRAWQGRSEFWTGCPAGYTVISVSCDGTVRGCPSLDIPAGNIRERPLREIWEDEGLFWYNSCWDEGRLQGRCRGCPYRRLCRGGCKSMALSTTGTIYRNIYCLNQVKNLGGDPYRREEHGRILP